MDLGKMATGWIPLDSAPEGMARCHRCGRDLPLDAFGTNPLRKARFLWCRECFESEATLLARRLAWYSSEKVPTGWPDMGRSVGEIERWLIDNAETPEGVRMAVRARSMMLPTEERGMLLEHGAEPSLVDGNDHGEDDPNRGMNSRLSDFLRQFGGGF